MPYLDDIRKGSVPDGYWVARFHPSGKLWIGDYPKFTDKQLAQERVDNRNESLADTSYGIRTPYFVWHSGLSDEDLEPYKAETSSNKIK